MEKVFTLQQLEQAEAFLAQQRIADITPVFEGMVKDIEQAVEAHCPQTETVQYFCFADPFEKLIYKKVENDERDIQVIDQPFDRVYADLAYCYIQQELWDEAISALAAAVRWNPMNCSHRLNLAELQRISENAHEWLGLSYSVFERAYLPEHLVRAYMNFVPFFIANERYTTAAACTKAAYNLLPDDPRVKEACESLKESGNDPLTLDDELCETLLEEQRIPEGANVAVVISALICADEALVSGDEQGYARYYRIATALVGDENAAALARIVKEES